MLLEIYFGRPIDGHSLGDGHSDSTLSIVARVSEWVHRERGNLSAAFGSAVSHCLTCLHRPGTDWHDAAFRDDMIEKVLLPLMREHRGCSDYNV